MLNNPVVTPNITALEYYERRQKLAKELPPDSIAILAGSDLKYASGAVFYKFHQDPDFLYLTGTYVTWQTTVMVTNTARLQGTRCPRHH